MPATYEPIATTTLGSAASSITFSSIASSWTDIRLVLTATASGGNGAPRLTFNLDTGSNYSVTVLYGDGSTAGSYAQTSQAFIGGADLVITANPTLRTYDIFSYAGSTNKTLLQTENADKNGSGTVARIVGLWRNTSAITSMTITMSANNFAIGTTATLYGIKNA